MLNVHHIYKEKLHISCIFTRLEYFLFTAAVDKVPGKREDAKGLNAHTIGYRRVECTYNRMQKKG